MNVYENGIGAILIVSHKSFCCSIDLFDSRMKSSMSTLNDLIPEI